MTEDGAWRIKYLDAIRGLDAQVADAKALESVIRRLVLRILRAVEGLNPAFDRAAAPLVQLMRSSDAPLDAHSLEGHLDEIARSLRGTPGSSPPAPLSADALFVVLLDRLGTLPGMQADIARLKLELPAADDEAGWRALFARVVELIQARCVRIHDERREIGELLEFITRELGAFDEYLAGRREALTASQADSEGLEGKFRDEFRGLQRDLTAAADDLAALKRLVSLRFEALGAHLRAFRGREAGRNDDERRQNELMRERVKRLETEAENLKEAMIEARRQALLDGLTGIPNRQAFEERLRDEHARWRRFATPLTLVIWDIDNFKAVNDTYGHQAGDKVIRAIAQFLMARARETDMVARYGGEEFVMILVGATGADALKMTDRIRHDVETMGFHFNSQPVPITISAGMSQFREGNSPEVVFDNADRALYEAKNTGRNRCVLR